MNGSTGWLNDSRRAVSLEVLQGTNEKAVLKLSPTVFAREGNSQSLTKEDSSTYSIPTGIGPESHPASRFNCWVSASTEQGRSRGANLWLWTDISRATQLSACALCGDLRLKQDGGRLDAYSGALGVEGVKAEKGAWSMSCGGGRRLHWVGYLGSNVHPSGLWTTEPGQGLLPSRKLHGPKLARASRT